MSDAKKQNAFAPRPAGLSLERILDLMADSGRLPQLLLYKTDRGYQCSLQRPDNMSRFGVFIKPTASEAIIAALGPDPYHSWEEHLQITDDPDNDDVSHLI